MSKPQRSRCRVPPLWSFVVGLALLLVLFLVYYADFGLVQLPLHHRQTYLAGWRPLQFSSKNWKAAKATLGIGWPPARGNLRARMVNDLVTHHLRVGMTRRQVERLLGTADSSLDYCLMYYSLMENPSVDQRAYARVRWGDADPYLVLTYKRNRLVEVKVGR